MKKIIPFTKDIKFNTKIYEVTSISLEHNLTTINNNEVTGEFIISGEYKMNDSSINSEPFIYGLPFDITLDKMYDIDKTKVDIDDFKFEIVNEELLRVNIDVLIEGEEITIKEEEEILPDLVIEARGKKEKEENIKDEKENNDIEITEDMTKRLNVFDNIALKEDEIMDNNSSDLFKQTDEKIEKVSASETITKDINSIFNDFNDKNEKYVSYYVHIVRENDNVDSICLKYGVSLDLLKEYNNIDQITLDSKIIIPYVNNETV